jgi:hypothetical protein
MATESRAEYYGRKATEARQMAEKLLDNSVLKDAHLQAEQAWLELAEQAQRSDSAHQQQQQQQQQQHTEPKE